MARPARVSRDQVLAAARAEFGARGYAGATLAAIAARVGLSPAALLRHARDKDALFHTAMAESPATAIALPLEFLRDTPGNADAEAVLRRIAEAFIPFVAARMEESIARWMYAKQTPSATLMLKLPFDPRSPDSPPRRTFASVSGWFRRAARAGRLRVENPQAAALAFLGACHAHVFFHRVLANVEPPVATDDYIDTLIAMWRGGALAKAAPTRKKSGSKK